MADRRSLVVPLLILAFILFAPTPSRAPAARLDARRHLDDAIAEEWRSLTVCQESHWDSEFGTPGHSINLTGVESDRGYAWHALSNIKDHVRAQLEYALGSWGLAALNTAPALDDPSPVALYQNVTGLVRGKWHRSALQDMPPPTLNMSHYTPDGPFSSHDASRPFDKNVTGSRGDISARIHHRRLPKDAVTYGAGAATPAMANVTSLSLELNIADAESNSNWDFQLYGLYFPVTGQGVLSTTSDKLAGIFLLPHLTSSPALFNLSKAALNDTIPRVIQKQVDGKMDSTHPWSPGASGEESPFVWPDCDLLLYLQQLEPISNTEFSSSDLLSLENELRFPTGASTTAPPDLRFSLTAFSPDCGFVLESQGPPDSISQDGDHLMGPKIEVQFQSSRQHLLAFTLALALQLALFIRQMREASTPSTRSRVSFYTIAMLAIGDGFATMVFLLLSLFIDGLWVNLIGSGFLAFISVSFFGMRFLMDIWGVQAPERIRHARQAAEEARRQREAQQAELRRNQALQSAAADGSVPVVEGMEQSGQQPQSGQSLDPTSDTTAPVTPPIPEPASTTPRVIDTGVLPVFMPSDQAGLEPINATANGAQAAQDPQIPSFASLYSRFYLILLGALFLSINAISWPSGIRRIYFTILGLSYLSFWMPQIFRNVQRNCRRALKWEFVIGQSLLRLVPFVYFYGFKDNIVFASVDHASLALLAIWVWLQVIVLVSQEIIGPRWFIRAAWAPPAYDYHPILREDDEGATLPVGFSQSNASTADSAPQSPTLEHRRNSSVNSDAASKLVMTPHRANLPRDSKDRRGNKRIYDCAICMQELEVPILQAGPNSAAGSSSGFADAASPSLLLARRAYMVTPCRHIFHSQCLEGWMKFRLQCPICRDTLPPM